MEKLMSVATALLGRIVTGLPLADDDSGWLGGWVPRGWRRSKPRRRRAAHPRVDDTSFASLEAFLAMTKGSGGIVYVAHSDSDKLTLEGHGLSSPESGVLRCALPMSEAAQFWLEEQSITPAALADALALPDVQADPMMVESLTSLRAAASISWKGDKRSDEGGEVLEVSWNAQTSGFKKLPKSLDLKIGLNAQLKTPLPVEVQLRVIPPERGGAMPRFQLKPHGLEDMGARIRRHVAEEVGGIAATPAVRNYEPRNELEYDRLIGGPGHSTRLRAVEETNEGTKE